MLTAYRRHVKNCPHRDEGRKYRRCRCPIWVDGSLNGVEIRESLEHRDWEKAQRQIREWEVQGVIAATVQPVTIEQACDAFLADAKARELQQSTIRKYRYLFEQMRTFSASEGLRFIGEWDDIEVLRRFRQSWSDSGLTVVKKIERLRAFLRFAHESKWIENDPGKKFYKRECQDKYFPSELKASGIGGHSAPLI